MTEYRKVVVEDDSASRNSLYMGIFVVAVVAIIAVALIMWQPWAASQATPSTNTTIIRDQPAQPSNDRTIIVPSVQAPPASTKTEINIETPPPTTNEKKTEETTSGETGGTETTGSETTGN